MKDFHLKTEANKTSGHFLKFVEMLGGTNSKERSIVAILTELREAEFLCHLCAKIRVWNLKTTDYAN